MKPSRLDDYLDQMRGGVGDALEFIEGQNKETFIADQKTRRAVILCLLITGEAAAKIMERYPDFADEHPSIPWQAMRGMRNRIAHRYFDLDLGIVWDTLQHALPRLLERLKAIS